MTVDSNGDSIGFISHAPFRSTDISAEIGATNEAKAFMQLANNSKAQSRRESTSTQAVAVERA